MEKFKSAGVFWYTVSVILSVKLLTNDVEVWELQNNLFYLFLFSLVAAGFMFAISKTATNKEVIDGEKKEASDEKSDLVLVNYCLATSLAFSIWLFSLFIVHF